MYKTLRILFTILSAVCIAVVIPVGAFGGWVWAIGCALFAVLFFGLMLLCKQSQQQKEGQADLGADMAEEETNLSEAPVRDENEK